jgi:hypothetical protein
MMNLNECDHTIMFLSIQVQQVPIVIVILSFFIITIQVEMTGNFAFGVKAVSLFKRVYSTQKG